MELHRLDAALGGEGRGAARFVVGREVPESDRLIGRPGRQGVRRQPIPRQRRDRVGMRRFLLRFLRLFRLFRLLLLLLLRRRRVLLPEGRRGLQSVEDVEIPDFDVGLEGADGREGSLRCRRRSSSQPEPLQCEGERRKGHVVVDVEGVAVVEVHLDATEILLGLGREKNRVRRPKVRVVEVLLVVFVVHVVLRRTLLRRTLLVVPEPELLRKPRQLHHVVVVGGPSGHQLELLLAHFVAHRPRSAGTPRHAHDARDHPAAVHARSSGFLRAAAAQK
mmetsp:Transcript_11552/g.37972  ORF Transcript_11552/g.37972 Transcript_11552/m.37972 type:complete len:277 (-) Transcript_11552:79-909(-)